jgi:hypothetical protein
MPDQTAPPPASPAPRVGPWVRCSIAPVAVAPDAGPPGGVGVMASPTEVSSSQNGWKRRALGRSLHGCRGRSGLLVRRGCPEHRRADPRS